MIFGITDNDSIVGLTNSKRDSEIISEQIKTKLEEPKKEPKPGKRWKWKNALKESLN